MSNVYEFFIKDNRKHVTVNGQNFDSYCCDWGKNTFFCQLTAFFVLVHEYGNAIASVYDLYLANYLAKMPKEGFTLTSNQLWYLLEKFEFRNNAQRFSNQKNS
jgi:hypothetical protein